MGYDNTQPTYPAQSALSVQTSGDKTRLMFAGTFHAPRGAESTVLQL